MRTVFNDGWKISGTHDRMRKDDTGFHGEVATDLGYVALWCVNNEDSGELNMRFIFNGREYSRRITDDRPPFTRKSATILASKFAREIAAS